MNLTNPQKKIRDAEGKFVVRACPGSGKTLSVAARMARILNDWNNFYTGIAVISFTNVAWQEIEKELKKTFSINVPIEYPHFLGTIDSFINNYIFLPYGHLILECKKRPILVGEPIFPWKQRGKNDYIYSFFDKVSYNIDGKIFMPSNVRNLDWKRHSEDIIKMKKSLNRQGFATQNDANYFSMRILEENESIAKNIASRFPYMIIDEAQDTSKIQMKIIEKLVEKGLKNIILVGDPDQAIFEWNGAEPKLFEDKMKEWGSPIIMNDNWRSSQNICDFTHKLSSLPKKSTSCGDNECSHEPEILLYARGNPNYDEIISKFLGICEYHNIIPTRDTVAILARSNNLIEEIALYQNQSSEQLKNINPWYKESFACELVHSKYLYDNYEFQQAIELLERTYISILNNGIYSDYKLSKLIERLGYFEFKKRIIDLINLMPETDKTLGEWIDEFQKQSAKYGIHNIEQKTRIKKKFSHLKIKDIFSYENIEKDYLLSSIHKAKGRTFEAVLLILKKSGQNKHYKTMLNRNENTANDEELRNVYVGITRPKKVLVLLVPSEDEKPWKDYFCKPKESQTSLENF